MHVYYSMERLQLDTVIGSSVLTRATFAVHPQTGATAFPSHGLVSILLPTARRRYDVIIDPACREIKSLAFSSTGTHLAVGERGPSARFFIATFTDSFDSATWR
jgi:hypothetical protein